MLSTTSINKIFAREILVRVTLAILTVGVFSSSSFAAYSVSGSYACYHPGVPYHVEVLGNPTGKWLPTHNTNNWTYKAVPGWDYFQKNSNASKKVYLKCKPKFGPHQRDVVGNLDKCGWRKGYPAKSFQPKCPVSTLTYEYVNGTCLAPQRATPNVPPSQFVIPFNNYTYCKTGAYLKYTKRYLLGIKNAKKLAGLMGANISCPAGEKYSVQTKNNADSQVRANGYVKFQVPDNVSKIFFSASVKPTNQVTPHLSERLGVMINDNEAGVANSHIYYPATGPAFDIGRTAFSIGADTTHKAIFQERWETEVIPDFVHFGVNLAITPNASVTPNSAGGTLPVVARFGLSKNPNPRTIVKAARLEYCAKLKVIKGENLQGTTPGLPTQIGTNGGAPKAETNKNPICKRGEMRFAIEAKTPANWLTRKVIGNGKTIICAKVKPREVPKPQLPKPDAPKPDNAAPKPDIATPIPPKPSLPKLTCRRGEKKTRPRKKAPYGWLVIKRKRGKQVVWCLRRDPNARPPRCKRGERLFKNARKIPRGWKKRTIKQGRYRFYCAKHVRIVCPKNTRLTGNRCVRKSLIGVPLPHELILGGPQKPRPQKPKPRKNEPRKDGPAHIKCPRGMRSFKGRCIKG